MMIDWLKDLLGVNRYALVWDFIDSGGRIDVHLAGRDEWREAKTKRHQEYVARGMNRIYGSGTHWIERV